jgi:hypothetical protein
MEYYTDEDLGRIIERVAAKKLAAGKGLPLAEGAALALDRLPGVRPGTRCTC